MTKEAIKEKAKEAIEKNHSHETSIADIQKQLAGTPSQISIVKLIDALIATAYEMRASDIHIDPGEKDIRVRFRIDGVLHDNFLFPKDLHSEIITRIKILAGLRTDEHQAAQDGRFKVNIAGHDYIDIRVSIAPTYYGENCVMRLLAEQALIFTLETLGFAKSDFAKVNRAIKKPYGMILATGPTGSGKTTTLYAILKILNTTEVSIITIEDPIEYSVQGIDQIQVNVQTELTFANGLRFILRQDPNIIMVGEIRDDETSRIAVNAAMTGHLLLSTLHTNDAATALPRLLDLSVEPFLVASTVNIIIGQRLVRTICSVCKVEKTLTTIEVKSLRGSIPDSLLDNKRDFFVGAGCKKCDNTGFQGRIGIHEVMEINDEIRELIMKRANANEIKAAASRNGMTTMMEDGIQKALKGITTLEEVLRVFHE